MRNVEQLMRYRLPAVAAASLALFASGCGQTKELSGVTIPDGAYITDTVYEQDKRHIKVSVESGDPSALEGMDCGKRGSDLVEMTEWSGGRDCFIGDVSEDDSEAVIQEFQELAGRNSNNGSDTTPQPEGTPQQYYEETPDDSLTNIYAPSEQ